MGKVIVMGSINNDIVTTVERHPKVGETIFGKTISNFPGGKGANQAVAAARMGIETSLIAQVGKDSNGDELIKFLRFQGVDTADIKQVSDSPTGCAIIIVAKGENNIVVIPGANEWGENPPELSLIKPDDCLVAQFETPISETRKGFIKAKEKGATTFLNPAPMVEFDLDLLKVTDFLIVNEIELATITNLEINVEDTDSVRDAVEKVLGKGASNVVVTLGAHGLVAAGSYYSESVNISGHSVSQIDSTGAGDCFVGVLAARHCTSPDQGIDNLKFANAAAALSVTKPGAGSSMPSAPDVEKFIQNLNH